MASTRPGDTIFDPFNGGGTTGIAVASIGKRKYIGCDLNKEYIDLTIRRYEASRPNHSDKTIDTKQMAGKPETRLWQVRLKKLQQMRDKEIKLKDRSL